LNQTTFKTAEEKFITLALKSKQDHAKAKLVIMELLDQVQEKQKIIAIGQKSNVENKIDPRFRSTLLVFRELC